MSQAFKFDFSGSTSPLLIYNSTGDLLFDGNTAALRAYGIFTSTVSGNTFRPYPPSPSDGTNAFSTTALGKTFSRPPFHVSFFQTGSTGWRKCYSSFSSGSGVFGAFVVATVDTLYQGNYSTTVSNFSSLVFENGVYG
jgi:hypothetical protein